MPKDFDEDDVEKLLQELEANNIASSLSKPSRRASSNTTTTTTTKAEPSTSSLPPTGSPSRVNFSTYGGGALQANNSPLQNTEGPRVLGRLTPLKGQKSKASSITNPGALPPVVWSQHKVALGGSSPPSHAKQDAASFLACLRESSSLSGPTNNSSTNNIVSTDDGGTQQSPNDREVNFLPVMHCRFLRDSKGITPRGRWGHSLTVIGEQLYLFGGTTAGDGAASSDLFSYSPRTNTWEPCFSEPETRPTPRYNHSAVSFEGRYLVVYGGKSSHGAATLGDMYAYDALTERWECWHRGGDDGQNNAPAGIHGHSAVVHKKKLFIFGGRVRKGSASKSEDADEGGEHAAKSHKKEVLSSDVFVFHLVSKDWKKKLHCAAKVTQNCGEQSTDATPMAPAKRMHHACCVHRGFMFVQGGEGSDGTVLADTWALDLNKRTWVQLHRGLSADSVPRSRHALIACGEAILSIGGCSNTSGNSGAVVRGIGALAHRFESFLSLLVVEDPWSRTVSSGGMWTPVVLGNSSCVVPTKKQFAAASMEGFLYVFGGSTGAEVATNHFVRCLAMDGVVVNTDEDLLHCMNRLIVPRSSFAGENSATSLEASPPSKRCADDDSAQKPQPLPFQFRWDCDIALVTVGSSKCYAHRALIAQRAPKFFADVLQCRCDEASDNSRSAAGKDDGGDAMQAQGVLFSPPVYYLTGNNRVRGLAVPLLLPQLHLLLQYLYTSSIELSLLTPDDVKVLTTLANTYEISHLSERLAGATSNDDDAPSRAHPEDVSKRRLLEDLRELSKNSLHANATILFVDPHTGVESSHAVHSWAVANHCDLFHRLLRPLWTGKNTNQIGDLVAKLTGKHVTSISSATHSGGKRSVIIGPLRIPHLSIRPILEHLYTSEITVAPECALPTMMGSHILGLRRLQSYCEALVSREEVNFETCCDFYTLARNYSAGLLEEMSLVTASAGFDDVKKSAQFQSLAIEQRVEIEKVAREIKGMWAPPPVPTTEQKPAHFYASKLPSPF